MGPDTFWSVMTRNLVRKTHMGHSDAESKLKNTTFRVSLIFNGSSPKWPAIRVNSNGTCSPLTAVWGRYTLRNKQSSLIPVKDTKYWTHAWPCLEASRVPVQGTTGTGGRKRLVSTGGSAYGIPFWMNTNFVNVKSQPTNFLSLGD